MSFPYEKILVIGATSGIGEALARKFLENDIKVVVVGRRKDKLDAFVSEHGSDRSAAKVFDISDLGNIPVFVKETMSEHPDIDGILLNSGLQRGFDFSKPDTVDLETFDLEWRTNYTAYVYLTHAFLPFLQKQADKQTALMYTSSGLALVPSPLTPGYGASKAALHHFILALREQLKTDHPNIKIIEIFPPAVQTELHEWMATEQQKNMGMPLNDFIAEAWSGLAEGKEQVPVGFAKISFDRWESARQAMFGQLVERLKSSH